jgi:2,3-bisphosphoglycerate-independent phosphoglycerate mutase
VRCAPTLLELHPPYSYTLLIVKYCVVIIDGASGWPLPERGGKTCLELARTPNLDRMAKEGTLGLVQTVPQGMEPSSACACMSILGYDPQKYYKGRSAIEAASMGIPIDKGEAAFRCNLVAVRDGKMWDYSAGHIGDSEAHALVEALNGSLGNKEIHFYPGVSYRHICKIKGHTDTLQATCTPPHDIPNKPIDKYLPHGHGSDLLRDLMARSVEVLRDHPVNKARKSRGEPPANMIWLFWGSGEIPNLPSFKKVYGLSAAMTSGVDLLKGLAKIAGIKKLGIPGVTGGVDNNCAAQATGALKTLERHDLVVMHIEAPDEASHGGLIDDKIKAIERVDKEVLSKLLAYKKDSLRILALPDHATPIEVRTHVADPVPFVLWGKGFTSMRAKCFSEKEAKNSGIFIKDGYTIMSKLIQGRG